MVQNDISQRTNPPDQHIDVKCSGTKKNGGKGARKASSTADATASHTPPPTEELLTALDDSLAQWQAQISLAYAQGASRELVDHLKLVNDLQDTLREREQELEQRRKEIEQLAADTLKRQANISRQRKSVAQSLRARKAEMLLQLQRQRGALASEAPADSTANHHSSNSDNAIELKTELLLVHEELEAQQERNAATRAQVVELQAELEAALLEQEAQRNANGSTESLESELQAARQRIAALERSPLDPESPATELEARLEAAELEIQDLLEQNSDLARQLAKQQVISSGHTPHVSFDQSLSWEERKKLILRQLENEDDDSSSGNEADAASQNRIEIQRILETTQNEIDKRDRQIAELQSIVEQQSDTRQGVAIGAAAFAQTFDNDELIQMERQKLKEIQREWEEKLRQAEIDLSMERAKLARERSQLEAELNAKPDGPSLREYPVQPKKHQWLEHLGLKDDNRADRT